MTPAAQRPEMAQVDFKVPVEFEGFAVYQRRLVAGTPMDNGALLPKITFDPVLRLVVCGRDLVPLEQVLRMRRRFGTSSE